MRKTFILSFLVILCQLLFTTTTPLQNLTAPARGQWALLHKSIGLVSLHMQLLYNDRVVIFDRTDFGKSNLSLGGGRCRNNQNDTVIKYDCTAHSAEYNVLANRIRPLMVQTDVWCSSGAVSPNGILIQTGGYNDGDRVVRVFRPCRECDWKEISLGLKVRRWYATNHILPNGRIIIIGGRRQFNYEFYPKSTPSDKVFSLQFLAQTNVQKVENNLYPFVHLNVDGHLFIFANNRAILLDYLKNVVVRQYPEIPGGDPRSYPSTGSSVLLPLKDSNEAEVLICGGAPNGSFQQALYHGKFHGALNTCGRIRITDKSPKWYVERMPFARVMGDMILLPNGHVLIINGASAGTAGWELGRNPVLHPVLYRPGNIIRPQIVHPGITYGPRFEILQPSTIPRLYHSTAILLRDGRVLVGGSNPHTYYNFTNVLFPTELSLEAFSPPYLESQSSRFRPVILSPTSQARLKYGQRIIMRFRITAALLKGELVSVTMIAPSFATHSFSMNQRLLVLGQGVPVKLVPTLYKIQVTMPKSGCLAPSGYYMLFVVNQDIPSEGIWIHIQ
ncbi:hypothetical protein GIB67_004203 [Kingdonia uniflora]|uniref:Galactose oxidase n=1 Tax=Kingdonia uniflora TaxID=39325 RepID=A0A7J7P195_9MAGN|nr:hypothetical protein GIB67_004203 [Kingdonia uniflora]